MEKKILTALARAAAVATLTAASACQTAQIPAAFVDEPGLTSALRATFEKDARLASATRFQVNPSTGVVTLSGRVETKEDRESAGRLVSSVKGVTVVYNELEIERAAR